MVWFHRFKSDYPVLPPGAGLNAVGELSKSTMRLTVTATRFEVASIKKLIFFLGASSYMAN